jgi:trigger factor
VAEQVKSEVMMVSLQQLGQDHDLAPLSEPELDMQAVILPQHGPLVYEFEVEVRPQFDLPPYKGLKLRRPVKIFTDDEVDEQRRLALTPFGQVVPKSNGNAKVGDVLVVDLTFMYEGRELTKTPEVQVQIEKDLVFKDALCRDFANQVKGVNAGESRTMPAEVSSSSANPELVGMILQARFDVKEVKRVILPELTPEFLLPNFGVQTPGALDEKIRVLLNRQLEHIQRRYAKRQVLEHIAGSVKWDLPRDLLQRQSRRSLDRRIMEMKADGMSEEQIEQQRRRLEQDILESTAAGLKEHFVLQKIAEVEKLEVDQEDLDDEIARMAEAANESPRRLRARMERDNLLDVLAAEMVERLALDLILDQAEYEDFALEAQADETSPMASSEVQAVPGALRDPVAPPTPIEPAAGESKQQ